MYFGSTPSHLWSGGHATTGSVPAAEWFLVEGATGAFFDTFVLLTNPADQAANVTLTYLLEGGETVTVPKVIPPASRLTVNVEAEDDVRLRSAAFSTRITADRPIVAERSVYWPGDAAPWGEAHNSAGLTTLGTRWGLAEARVGGARAFQTYILLANAQTTAAQVTVTYLRESGAPVVKTYIVPPTSRFTIDVKSLVPELVDESFGALIEVINDVPIAVERSMYWDANGIFWSGGTNATATRLQ
jgi:hypothetical protein